ncbi:MAG: IS66 family insertion sequence element accessory protein TnpB [Bacteroidota bacterium]
MLSIGSRQRFFWYRGVCDMRKSFAGLCRLVETEMGFDLVSGDVFVFVNRRRDRMKMLMWDRSGFVIWYKRLEEGTYEIPDLSGGQGEIGWEDLLLILEEGGFAVGPASQTLCSSTAKYG